MQVVRVTGRFVREDRSLVQGELTFFPNMLTVDTAEGEVVPRAAVVELEHGEFEVYLSRTDQADLPWHYTVNSPVGSWTIRVESDGPLLLKDLLPKRFA